MQSAQFNMARQAASARAAAYNAQMRPVRLANASRVRAEKIARRTARTEFRIAKLEAAKKEQQAFLAKARTWTDSTGSHRVLAVLVDATDVAVKLRKQDGDVIAVPLERLSSPDQSWVASAVDEKRGEKAVMLVSL
jgi:septal ring factor EnvC (AmiA/AmiB activator)